MILHCKRACFTTDLVIEHALLLHFGDFWKCPVSKKAFYSPAVKVCPACGLSAHRRRFPRLK